MPLVFNRHYDVIHDGECRAEEPVLNVESAPDACAVARCRSSRATADEARATTSACGVQLTPSAAPAASISPVAWALRSRGARRRKGAGRDYTAGIIQYGQVSAVSSE